MEVVQGDDNSGGRSQSTHDRYRLRPDLLKRMHMDDVGSDLPQHLRQGLDVELVVQPAHQEAVVAARPEQKLIRCPFDPLEKSVGARLAMQARDAGEERRADIGSGPQRAKQLIGGDLSAAGPKRRMILSDHQHADRMCLGCLAHAACRLSLRVSGVG